jgi:hypothetical protein
MVLEPARLEGRWPRLDRVTHWLERLLGWMDGAFQIPGTRFRIGLDPIIGLLFPTAGDAVGGAISLSAVLLALQYRLPLWVVARMVGNIAVDSAVGAVPVLGDLFDFAWKANDRNLALWREHRARLMPARTPLGYWLAGALLLMAALACVALPIFLTVLILRALFGAAS